MNDRAKEIDFEIRGRKSIGLWGFIIAAAFIAVGYSVVTSDLRATPHHAADLGGAVLAFTLVFLETGVVVAVAILQFRTIRRLRKERQDLTS